MMREIEEVKEELGLHDSFVPNQSDKNIGGISADHSEKYSKNHDLEDSHDR